MKNGMPLRTFKAAQKFGLHCEPAVTNISFDLIISRGASTPKQTTKSKYNKHKNRFILLIYLFIY